MLTKDELDVIRFVVEEEKIYLEQKGEDITIQSHVLEKIINEDQDFINEEINIIEPLIKEEKNYLSIYGDEKDLHIYDVIVEKLENKK